MFIAGSAEVICAIRDYGFKSSPFPIVLSIENHCSYQQQQSLAAIMRNELGGALVLPMSFPNGLLPSPADLTHKVLVKGKRTKPLAADDDADNSDSDGEDGKSSKSGPKAAIKRSKSKKQEEVHPELSAVVFLGTTKVHSFKDEIGIIPPDMMTSFSEKKMIKNVGDPSTVEEWIAYNNFHLR